MLMAENPSTGPMPLADDSIEHSLGVARRYNRRGLSHCCRSRVLVPLSALGGACLVTPEESVRGSLWP